MAAISKVSSIAGNVTKLFANHSGLGRFREDPAPVSSLLASPARRAAFYSSSSYDKNVDDQVRPAVVPDYLNESGSNSYWGPHPTTGIFGPAYPESGGANGLRIVSSSSSTSRNGGGSTSVLDRTVWFRSGGEDNSDDDHHEEEEEPPF